MIQSTRYRFLFSVSLLLSLVGCGDEAKVLSLVEEVRVPVAQFYSESSPEEAKNRSGCETFLDNKTYCQQYPLRFGKKSLIRFVTVSKLSQKPTVTVKYLQKLNLKPAGQSIVSSLDATKIEPSFLKVTKEPTLSKVLQEKGLRVDSQVYSLEVPSLDSFLSSRNSFPAFNLQYIAEAAGSPSDEGYISFYIYPDQSDETTWSELAKQAKQNGIDPKFLELTRQKAKTNTPPTIVSLSPNTGAKNESSKELTITLSPQDKDAQAKSRIQWFVSSGELSLQRSKVTKWSKVSESEDSGVFVMLRDLQGGIDFKYASYSK
jgi:hypothetical protein